MKFEFKKVLFPTSIFLFVVFLLIKLFLLPKKEAANSFAEKKAEITSFQLEYIVITETPVPTVTPKPTITPTPTRILLTSLELDALFTKYANNYSVSRDLLFKIAACESGLNPYALNGIYGGMFQFSSVSWIATRKLMNLTDSPQLRFDPEEAIKTAAFKLSIGGLYAWPNCGK